MPTQVKICGLMTPETVDAALDGGADYIGVVFFPARRGMSMCRPL